MELKEFLVQASEAGYAAEDATIRKSDDGTHTIEYESGGWRYHDESFGGEPYGGREVVFHGGKAVWFAAYYGRIYDTDLTPDEVYGFLRKALRAAPEEIIYRGPEEFSEGTLVYTNECTGELATFSGTERILENGEEIYSAKYFGGEVDRRPGD